MVTTCQLPSTSYKACLCMARTSLLSHLEHQANPSTCTLNKCLKLSKQSPVIFHFLLYQRTRCHRHLAGASTSMRKNATMSPNEVLSHKVCLPGVNGCTVTEVLFYIVASFGHSTVFTKYPKVPYRTYTGANYEYTLPTLPYVR